MRNRLIAAAGVFFGMALMMFLFSGPNPNKNLEKLDKFGVVTEAVNEDGVLEIQRGGTTVYLLDLSYKTPKGEVRKKFPASKEFVDSLAKRGRNSGLVKIRYLPADPQIARLVGDIAPEPAPSKIPLIGSLCFLGLLVYFGWRFRHLIRGASTRNDEYSESDATPNTLTPKANQQARAGFGASNQRPTINVRAIFPRIKFAGLKVPTGPLTAEIGIGDSGQVISGDNNLVVQAMAGGLGVMYAIDAGQHFEYLVQSEFKRMGFTHEQLHKKALENLERWVNESGKLQILTLESKTYGIAAGGDFEAALLLLDSLWEGPLKERTPNGVVCVIPLRDICMFCDARNVEGIRTLKSSVQKLVEQGTELLSKDLYRRAGGKWRAFPISFKPAVESIDFN